MEWMVTSGRSSITLKFMWQTNSSQLTHATRAFHGKENLPVSA